MVQALVAAGTECAVISFDGWRPRSGHKGGPPIAPEAHEGVPVLRVSNTGHLDAARRFAAEQDPDRIHVHHAMLWELAAELPGPRLYTVHVLQGEQNRLRGLPGDHVTMSLAAQHRALAEADRVIAPSRAVAELLLRDHAELEGRVEVIGLGLEPGDLGAPLPSQDQLAGGPVLFVGRFADLNGIAELMAALPRILERAPERRAMVVGGMPDNRKAERKRLRRWYEDTPAEIRERVEFTGWLDRAGVQARYARAALLLAPSWFETFGQVLLEAMAHGLPIVSTTAGAIPELIEDGVSGALVPPQNVDALVSKTVELLTDPALALRLGRGAAAVARSRGWDGIIPDLVAAYCASTG
jgi:glycosyltransferase involved in cell wall biosynthesis